MTMHDEEGVEGRCLLDNDGVSRATAGLRMGQKQ